MLNLYNLIAKTVPISLAKLALSMVMSSAAWTAWQESIWSTRPYNKGRSCISSLSRKNPEFRQKYPWWKMNIILRPSPMLRQNPEEKTNTRAFWTHIWVSLTLKSNKVIEKERRINNNFIKKAWNQWITCVNMPNLRWNHNNSHGSYLKTERLFRLKVAL